MPVRAAGCNKNAFARCWLQLAAAHAWRLLPRSFYFWVDVVATASILLDIPAIVDPVISSVSAGSAAAALSAATSAAACLSVAGRRFLGMPLESCPRRSRTAVSCNAGRASLSAVRQRSQHRAHRSWLLALGTSGTADRHRLLPDLSCWHAMSPVPIVNSEALPCCLSMPVVQANDGNGDVQQRSGMENAAQITGASTRAARLAQVRGAGTRAAALDSRPAVPCCT